MTIARRSHLFPSRTQKLSSLAPMILGGKLPGKAGRCRFTKWLHGQAVKTPPFHGGNPSSILGGVTKYARLAELADALDLGSSGRPWGFKSLIAHHKYQHTTCVLIFFSESGNYSEEVTPVPISNTEVKLFCADDTWWEATWESRTLPDSVFIKIICGSMVKRSRHRPFTAVTRVRFSVESPN